MGVLFHPIRLRRRSLGRRIEALYHPVRAVRELPEAKALELWSAQPIPDEAEEIPFAEGVEQRTNHRPAEDGYKLFPAPIREAWPGFPAGGEGMGLEFGAGSEQVCQSK